MIGSDSIHNSRYWTFMVYLAGDNNLQDYGVKDLREMKKVGSSSNIAITAQFDTMSDMSTRRYYLTSQGNVADDIVDLLPETNTGDPDNLLDFIEWSVSTYPARNYALVLWNHGSGWKEDSIYKSAERIGTGDQVTSSLTRSLSSRRTSRSLFRTSIEWFVENPQRAIAYDDSSADFLDNQELREVLSKTCTILGKPLDLLGFDACLMNMIEVAYQLNNLARYLTGSQEVEPGEGWPYHRVLAKLVNQPEISPEELSILIVKEFAQYYREEFPGTSVTQSAISMSKMSDSLNTFDNLAKALTIGGTPSSKRRLAFSAMRTAQKFSDPDYFDLLDLVKSFSQTTTDQSIKDAAQQMIEHMSQSETPILANEVVGDSVSKASGLSIYYPARTLSPLYQNLLFAKNTHWCEYLTGLIQS